MPSPILHDRATSYIRSVPEIRPGFTVRVHERVQEGNKERIQIFEGLVIAMHRGHVATDATFTVRRIVSGIGVEKIFPLHAPTIEKIEVKKVAKTRRAKLFFLRGRSGKSARLIERYTSAEEFGAKPVPAKAQEPAAEVETPTAEAAPEAAPAESAPEQAAA